MLSKVLISYEPAFSQVVLRGKVIYILSRKALAKCPLLHGNMKKETDTETETEKLIYNDFRIFSDCSKK